MGMIGETMQEKKVNSDDDNGDILKLL